MEAGPGLRSGDTAVSMTQGLLSEAPSHPGTGVTPAAPPAGGAASAASAVNDNCSSPPASPESCLNRH